MEKTSQPEEHGQAEDQETNHTVIAAVFGATDVPIFAYLGHVLFDDPVFGGIVGLLIGGGAFLFLPYILQASEDANQPDEKDDQYVGIDESQPTDLSDLTGGFHRAAAGFALAPAGFVLLS